MSALARLGEHGAAAQREDPPLRPRRHVLVRRAPGPFALRWALLTCLLLGCGDDAAGTPATTIVVSTYGDDDNPTTVVEVTK